MKNQDLLTIKEFAELSGKSQQAIYKQLNNRLNQFVQLVENQKMLEFRALKEVYGIEVEQPIQPKLNNQFNQNSADLSSVISVLKEQLNVKDKQIEQLRTELADERKHSREISDKLVTLTDQSQKLQLAQMTVSDTALIEDNQDSKKHWSLFRKRRK